MMLYMGLRHSWKTFCNAEEKTRLIKEVLLRWWQSLYYRRKFKHFGKRSILIKPGRLTGKKAIYIGNHVTVLQHCRMEAVTDWRGEKFQPGIYIGDRTQIGQNFHLAAAQRVEIGTDVTISGNVLITDLDHQYQEPGKGIHKQDISTKATKIGDCSFIGFGAVIQAGTVLGKQCVVGSNAVVRGVFDDYCVIVGAPARVVKKYDPVKKQWVKV